MSEANAKPRRRWFQFSLRTLLVVVTLVAGLFVALRAVQRVHWVGQTDVEVSLVVTDAATGQAIPKATIHIRVERGGFSDDPEPREFTITADENGHAKHLCKNCMSYGSTGFFEDTFFIHLPWWWFSATAANYSDSDSAYLDMPDHARQVHRGKPFATVTIPIRLRQSRMTND